MVTTTAQGQFLAAHGWPVEAAEPFDLCWLDCNRKGWLKTVKMGKPGHVTAMCICLCTQHAVVLEEGAWGSDYTGAPLPPDSEAGEWPWRPCAEVGVAVA